MIKFICIFVGLLACFSAQSTTINVCYEEWKPYAYIDELGKKTGTVLDKLKALSGHHQIEFQFEQTSYSRCVEYVRRGVYDFALFTNEEDVLSVLPTPITTWDLTLVVHKDNLDVPLFDGSRPRTVLISHEYQYPKPLMNKLLDVPFKFKKTSYFASNQKEIRQLFKDVLAKDVDAILIDINWANLMISQLNLPLAPLVAPLHSELQYIGYKNTDKNKLEIMKRFMQEYAKP